MKVLKSYFMLLVDDMDRATDFYRDVFGLRVRFVSPVWSELTWGDATIAFHGGRGGIEPQRTGLGFEVDDVGAACQAVVTAGGQVVIAPADREGEAIRLAEVADPEGNMISVAQPV
jgi:lactoylglutathione lyase